MTSRIWTHQQASAAWSNPTAWSPTGVPQPGDIATVGDGLASLDGSAQLSGVTIVAGSTVDDPGPYSVLNWTYISGGETTTAVASPNPTLEMNQGTIIDANTVIEAPQAAVASGQTIGATFAITGSVVNNGTIGLPVDGSGAPSVANFVLNITDGSTHTLINDGQINIAPQESSTWVGGSYDAQGFLHPGGFVTNNGTINVYGTLLNNEVGIEGSGTIMLDSVSNNLGLPPTPGLLQLNGEVFSGGVGTDGTVVFNGGHLGFGFDHGSLGGTLVNFGDHPTDMIRIDDFTLSNSGYNGSAANRASGPGVLTLVGSDPKEPAGQTLSLTFANLPTTGGFAIAADSGGVDVTWNPTPAPVVPKPPVLHPIPHPTPIYPPGYHLS
jgi:hypothetical protein